jgi:GAF domain-containing protein
LLDLAVPAAVWGRVRSVPLPDESVSELTALAGVVLSHDDINTTLNEICRIAVRAVPRADGASLTAMGEGGPGAVAASDDWAMSLDEMQYEEHEGPCLDAARTGVVFRIRDMANEPRWPSYMPKAVEQGARSMVSLPMTVESKTLGALNVYARVPEAFGAVEVSIAEVIAGHANLASQTAATLFRHRDVAEQLKDAMRSRAVIEQAKGALMCTRRCSADDAWAILVELSQQSNTKLRDVAAQLMEAYAPQSPSQLT